MPRMYWGLEPHKRSLISQVEEGSRGCSYSMGSTMKSQAQVET